jgi:hypothetical protein
MTVSKNRTASSIKDPILLGHDTLRWASSPSSLDTEDEDSTILLNVGNYSQNNTALHPRTLECSTTPL